MRREVCFLRGVCCRQNQAPQIDRSVESHPIDHKFVHWSIVETTSANNELVFGSGPRAALRRAACLLALGVLALWGVCGPANATPARFGLLAEVPSGARTSPPFIIQAQQSAQDQRQNIMWFQRQLKTLGLPSTDDEVRMLSAFLGAGTEGTVIGDDATEHAVRTAPLDRYRVISFATHGFLSREVAEYTGGKVSEMALALRPGNGEDGLLTSSEAAALRLNADWVLLSACNTAAGEGDDAEGLSGLARAFFFAGAETLLVSHWPIDDTATPALLSDVMLRSISGDTLSRAQALRQAQLTMLSQPQYAHPFYWAPFSVVGDNR